MKHLSLFTRAPIAWGFALLMAMPTLWAATTPYTVTFVSGPSTASTTYPGSQVPTLFNMVPTNAASNLYSRQQLKFTITSNTGANIFCSYNNTPGVDSLVGGSGVAALGGCAYVDSTGKKVGAGSPYTLVLTIQAGSTPQSVSDGLVISTPSGRNMMTIPINYTIVTNSSRTITFTNNCPTGNTVWFGATPSAVAGSCANTATCPQGTVCQSDTTCAWPQPAFTTSNTSYELQPGQSNTVSITDTSALNGLSIVWSGFLGGRTGCTGAAGTSCATGDCQANSSGACTVGFVKPATGAEFTFNVAVPDSYDVSIINGINLPIDVTPSNIPAAGTSSPYDCGSPGDPSLVSYTDTLYSTTYPSPAGTLGGSTWSFAPVVSLTANYLYQWVSGTGSTPACTVNTGTGGCDSYPGTVCGLSQSNVTLGNANLTCGTPLGYWTQDQICASNSTYNQSAIVNCTDTSVITSCTAGTISSDCPYQVQPATGPNYTFYNLVAGTSAFPTVAGSTDNTLTFASCFAKDVSNVQYTSSLNCSGCNNWQDQLGSNVIPTDPAIVAQCNSSSNPTGTIPNSNWVNSVLPGLIFLKTACPSCYTYPYDDKSSGFACPYAYETGQSAVNYTVTFCPNGTTALPTPGQNIPS